MVSDDVPTVVKLDNVHKTYLLGVEGVPALRGVSVDIKKGDFVTVLGKSGGGKTTVLNIIGTIDRLTKGSLTLCGQRITPETQDSLLAALRLSKLGFVFQTFNLISSMNAFENVCLPMILLGKLSNSEIKDRATALLTKVGLGHRLKHMPNMLSGGEQQRVTIARALANEPEILLLDEPTGDLDTKASNVVMEMLYKLNVRDNITMVMVTHDVALKRFASRVLHMLDGKLQREESIPTAVRVEEYSQLREKLYGKNAPYPKWAASVNEEYAGQTCRVTDDEEADKCETVAPDVIEVGRTGETVFETRTKSDYGLLSTCFEQESDDETGLH